MSIEGKILSYFGRVESGVHDRYRSWEHCYGYFQKVTPPTLLANRQDAAIQLGFYLASWGMYRGRSFLLQHAYTVHLAAVECLADPRWSVLWTAEFGSRDDDDERVDLILELRDSLWNAYKPFGAPTDTLITKIMLGTVACLPALDRYFIAGFKNEGNSYSCFNGRFVAKVLRFCRENVGVLQRCQRKIEKRGAYYPLMKLVDMYFFQTGYDLS